MESLPNRRLRVVSWAAGFLASALISTPLNAAAVELQVFAAASLGDALDEIASNYRRESGQAVALNLAGSSTLARQIAEGAPADVFFSADEASMDRLEHAGLLVPGSRRSSLSNTLVVVVPIESTWTPKSPRELASAHLQVLALAEPESVPAGIYAKAYLHSNEVWTELADRVVPTENVRAALAAVEAGNADAAIVYKTDAAISKKVRVAYEVSRADGPAIYYALAAVSQRGDRVRGEAQNFLAFLERPEGRAVFVKYGFLLIP